MIEEQINDADDIDNDVFFRTPDGNKTIVRRQDLEHSVDEDEIPHIDEITRYWVSYPYSYISICHSNRDNEMRYFVVEPTLNETEARLINFISDEIRTSIRHDKSTIAADDEDEQRGKIRSEVISIIQSYGLSDCETIKETTEGDVESSGFMGDILPDGGEQENIEFDNVDEQTDAPENGKISQLKSILSNDDGKSKSDILGEFSEVTADVRNKLGIGPDETNEESIHDDGSNDGGKEENETVKDAIEDGLDEDVTEYYGDARDYGADLRTTYIDVKETVDGNPHTSEVELSRTDASLTDHQTFKIMYYIERDFLGYRRIDPIKNDVNVEDISSIGYNEPVFVFHSRYDQLLTNVYHGEAELDSFITKIAQDAGKDISRRNPQVDAILRDGSRAQLTLGEEVNEGGSNYTIRQFKEIPFTPIDLINWETYSLGQMGMLWMGVEHGRSMLVAGGTGAGKTTALNALSLFIPASNKISSIEDTREVQLPQKNWIPSTTRESAAGEDDAIDEYDLLETSLRMRPDYIIVGEVRGAEGYSMFQAMSTGHTTFTTFHSDTVDDVIKRFTTEPINVPLSMFTTLDFIVIQEQVQVENSTQRRVKGITEVTEFDTEKERIIVDDIYKWNPKNDKHEQETDSEILNEMQMNQGWSREMLFEQLFRREILLSYLIHNEINYYNQVSTAIQAFINDQDTILALIANDTLKYAIKSLETLRTVDVQSDEASEKTVPRPNAGYTVSRMAKETLATADKTILKQYRGENVDINIGIVDSDTDIKDDAYQYTTEDEEINAAYLSENTQKYLQQLRIRSNKDTPKTVEKDESNSSSEENEKSKHGMEHESVDIPDNVAYTYQSETEDSEDGNSDRDSSDEMEDITEDVTEDFRKREGGNPPQSNAEGDVKPDDEKTERENSERNLKNKSTTKENKKTPDSKTTTQKVEENEEESTKTSSNEKASFDEILEYSEVSRVQKVRSDVRSSGVDTSTTDPIGGLFDPNGEIFIDRISKPVAVLRGYIIPKCTCGEDEHIFDDNRLHNSVAKRKSDTEDMSDIKSAATLFTNEQQIFINDMNVPEAIIRGYIQPTKIS